MTTIIYFFINIITKIHTKLLSLNDAYELSFTDKQLHFLVIGVFGLFLIMLIQPIFEWLVKHDAVLLITFIYVFSAIIVVTFAIEIGQGFTGTGNMEFKDILYGIFGFFIFFAIYLIGYILWKSKKHSLEDKKEDSSKEDDLK